ncbi:MAG: sensor histidine kinase [Bacteroidales bacterium]
MTDGGIEPRGRENEPLELRQRLISAREEERALVARELHDDVIQRLALLSIELGSVERAERETEQTEKVRAVRHELRRLSDDVHSLSRQMHPSVLDDVGLVEALRSECRRRCRQDGIEVSVDVGPLPVVGRDEALCLYRVLQEALNNVRRHARSRTARVVLRQADGGLRLVVHDNGVGFDPGRPKRRDGLGLVSMRERVRLVNGTFHVDSDPGRGTAVIAWVPAERP